jgi:hypothetical protein
MKPRVGSIFREKSGHRVEHLQAAEGSLDSSPVREVQATRLGHVQASFPTRRPPHDGLLF